MIKVDFYMDDFSELHKAVLYKENNINNSQVETQEGAEKLIKNEMNLYFCTNHVQGVLITDKIMEYWIHED